MPVLTRPNSWLPLEVPPPFEASGAFETCRVKAGKVLFLAEHLRRLKASLQTLGVLHFKQALKPLLQAAAQRVQEGFVRVAVRRNGEGGNPVVLHEHPGVAYVKREVAQGVSVVTAATRGTFREPSVAQAKGSERLSSILARIEGGQAFEVLRLGSHGYLTEGTVSNLFLVKRGILITPACWLGVLGGVTRTRILKYAKNIRINHMEIPVTRHDLFNADEAFLTNVLMGILPVREVDGRQIGEKAPGPITCRLMRAIEEG